MDTSRRKFLQNTLFATAGTLMVPQFIQAIPRQVGFKGKKLVVIQLSGGNDGLNTVIPYENDIYYRERPRLSIPKNEVIKLTDEAGLNPALSGLQKAFDEGWLSIVNQVGYPNPNRSHFRAMDIWQSGSSAEEYWQTGWLGRYLDANCPEKGPLNAIQASDGLEMALKGATTSGMAVGDPNKLYKSTKDPALEHIAKENHQQLGSNLDFMYKTLRQTQQSAEYVYEKSRVFKAKEAYPKNKFGRQMQMVAELICSGATTPIYYLSLSGFDTHVQQKGKHARLLQNWSDALYSFLRELNTNGQLENTLVMTFSEFGRRVAQNASNGTDHGKANTMFLAGGNLKKPGLINKLPDLVSLDDGDLSFKIDFRQVYANVLEDWLETDSKTVLKHAYSPVNLV